MSESEWPEPAYSIRTERLVLRCFERSDVRSVHTAILANVDSLRPWMPWIEHEPLTFAQRAALLRSFRASFDFGDNFVYGVFDRADGRYLGGAGLHPRISSHGLEIGYWIVNDRWGEGLATEAAGALTRVAFDRMEADRVEIRISPRNARSLRVPQKLGYEEEGTLRGVGPHREGLRDDLVVYGMLPHDFPSSPAAEVSIELEGFGFDA